MAEEAVDELAKFERNARDLKDLLGHARAIQNQNITISGNTLSWVCGLVGIGALIYAVFAVREANIKIDAQAEVHAAQKETQEMKYQMAVSDMSQIRARLMQLENYKDQHARRLADLEKGDK